MAIFDDRKDYGEIRELAIGLVNGREVTVCYTDRGRMRRIISARNATPGERKKYWKQMSP